MVVVMRGYALTHTHIVMFISQVSVRGNGCAVACLQAVLYSDSAAAAAAAGRSSLTLPGGSTKLHVLGTLWVYECCNQTVI